MRRNGFVGSILLPWSGTICRQRRLDNLVLLAVKRGKGQPGNCGNSALTYPTSALIVILLDEPRRLAKHTAFIPCVKANLLTIGF